MILSTLMKASKVLFISCLLLVACVLSSCTIPFLGKNKKSALQVTSNPKTTVFLNDEHVGQTPYFDENLKAGEYRLKLVPESSNSPLLSWQGMIKLSPGILTVVNRNLGESEDLSSGHILTLEPITEKEKCRISIISTPDSVVVNLDSEPKGFTPLSIDDVDEGEHLLTISSPGFKEEVIKAKTVKGHKLTVNVQLAKEGEEKVEPEEEEKDEEEEEVEETEEKASPKPKASTEVEEDDEATNAGEEMELPYVKLKDNPWGYLNVRSEPSTSGGKETVIAEVHPGEVYAFIEENDDGWYKIEYEEGNQGWISGKYALLYE